MRNSDWSSDVGSSDLASPSPPSWPAPTSRPNSAQPSSPKSRGSAPRRLPRAPPFPNCSPVSHPVPTTAEPPYLRALNEPQREAVLTTEGPVLVLAGAGTGKTAALTARLAHLVAPRRAWPSELLPVTFPNKTPATAPGRERECQ